MENQIIKVINYIKREFQYYKLKNMNPSKYPTFLKIEYKKRTGEVLNLDNPKKYTEKMQYSKLYDNTSEKTLLSDKYLVREWVADKIGSEYLIPMLGVWDNYSDMDFNKLPNRFILKTNHSSGWNLIVNDKEEINHFKEKIRFNRWLNRNYAYVRDLQLHYKDIEPKIIAEKFIEDKSGLLIDYRFICFDGEVFFCWVDFYEGDNHYSNIYNLEWELQPWKLVPMENYPKEIPRPEKFNEMLNIATKLSAGFLHARVDLYSVNNKTYFGEITFTSTGGYRLIEPEEYNYKIGQLWDISDIKQNNE